MSSINSIGTFSQNGNLATFIPSKTVTGQGDLWVRAADTTGAVVSKSIPVYVGVTPTPSPTPTPTPTPTPIVRSLQIISPNGGESITLGSPVTITWNSTHNYDKIALFYVAENYQDKEIANPVPDTGSYTWTASTDYPSQTRYKIGISGTVGFGGDIDLSDDYFTMTQPPTPTPTPTPIPCIQNNPTVSILPSFQSIFVGQSLTYNVSLTNNDTSTCSSRGFTIKGNPPGDTWGISYSPSANGFLNPGQTVNVKVGFIPQVNTPVGSGQVSVSIYSSSDTITVSAGYELLASPTATPTPLPTATPTPIPTATPTPTPIACKNTDINKDGTVDSTDIAIILSNFWQTNPTNARADINSDGIVDITDYSMVVRDYGQSTGACQ